MSPIVDDRRTQLETLVLHHGSHASFEQGHCAMEAAAWLAGERHTDSPSCVSLVIRSFLISLNDRLPDDETRTQLLRPLLPDVLDTATTTADDETRAWLATDWLVRVHTPAWLRLGGLTEQADRLEALQPLTPTTCPAIQSVLDAVRRDAAAAWAAARDAAGDAARAAARAAAWDAAGAAARDAAGAAARDHREPTMVELQTSVQDLVRRMATVGRQGGAR